MSFRILSNDAIWLRRVDVFSFSVALQDLIAMQEKEVELAVVGKGEYRICQVNRFFNNESFSTN